MNIHGEDLQPKDLAEDFDGEKYFTVKNFALATRRSPQSVRFLMSYGNRIRRLEFVRKMDKPLIPYRELLEFPFTVPGRRSKDVYHYNEDGSTWAEKEQAI